MLLQPRDTRARGQGLLCASSGSVRTSLLRPHQEFWNWFDPTAWYPLGRVVGGTIYPGLMATSGVIYNALKAINIPVDIRNICVMLAPGFSALTAWSTYMYGCTRIRAQPDDADEACAPGSRRR
jgi:hypothetical protein